ncbi:hypothetical protein H4S08_003648 [Coemansia sp. RSA 1365]|nr:hypothetical protein H4S08_003648 [Coemansia sp. RSA 1365]
MQRCSASHPSNPSYYGFSSPQVTSARKEEMMIQVKSRILENVECVVEQAQPRDAPIKKLADDIIRSISESIEKLVVAAGNSDAPDVACHETSAPDADGLPSDRDMIGTTLPWIRLTTSSSTTKNLESRLYSAISGFIHLVARMVYRELSAINRADSEDFRIVLPYRKNDVTPDGADDATKIDIGLRSCRVDGGLALPEEPDYWKMLAVIKVKRDAKRGNAEGAYAQLFGYTRNIYYNQPDRRFAWGLICCGSTVNACIFDKYKVYASPDIEMTSAAGRKEFVRLLVGWSLCRKQQLGYDETIQYMEELGCYRIMVPKIEMPEEVTPYYSNVIIKGADRLFGRHCRCFLATDKVPSERVTERKPIDANVVIKDSWSLYSDALDLQDQSEDRESGDEADEADYEVGVTADMARMQLRGEPSTAWPDMASLPAANSNHASTARSEVAMLRRIKDRLRGQSDLDGLYPSIIDGGWLYQPSHSKPTLDCTEMVIGDLSDEQQKQTPFSLHVRYAMTPIGKPLQTLSSILELIVILYDVMRCHAAIYRDCGIMHRDISANNIMVVQTDEGPHGLLIDFDCAFDSSVAKSPVRPERTGTLPYMSIGNLARSSLPHNILDDWESLLYLICWTGTFGIQESGPVVNNDRELLIKSWTTGSLEYIAKQKKSTMDNRRVFRQEILRYLDEGQADCWRLEELAEELHKTLFYNNNLEGLERAKCHGAVTTDLSEPCDKEEFESKFCHIFDMSGGMDISTLGSDIIDPFVERAKHAKMISEDLLLKLQKHAESARAALVESRS